MVKSVDFAVRNVAGGVSRGTVSGDGASDFVLIGSGDEISLNLRQSNILKYERDGSDLVVELVDGRKITLSGFFDAAGGEENKLFLSADGEIAQVTLESGSEGVIYADYHAVSGSGPEKWGPYDQLTFVLGDEIIAPAGSEDTTGMAMFAPLLGGSGLWGAGAAVAGAGVIAGSGGGGGGGGTDTTPGGGGTDTTPGGGGTDTTPGGGGTDTTPGGGGTDTTPGGGGTDTTPGGGGTDTTPGGGGTDTTPGGGGTDTTPGGGGTDTTPGGGGTDTTPGGGGTDTTPGGGGTDTTPGGGGTDTTPGGGGTDTTPGGGGVPIVPTVDNPNNDTTLTTNTVDPHAAVTGTGEPGSTVVVTIGDQTETTTIGEEGTWGVDFDSSELPADGDYSSVVVVTAPDGTVTNLDGPDFLIDMTPPDVAVTEGTNSVGDLENQADYVDGVTIGGTGEAGATVAVTVLGSTQTTTVAADGSWSVTFPQAEVPGGEYSTGVTVVATDPLGNTTTVTDTLVVDTVPSAITFNPVASDDIVNKAEHDASFTVSGTSVAGSSIAVTLEGVTHSTTVAADGSWSVTYAAAEIPSGEYVSTVSATSTDAAGNTLTETHAIRVDTTGHVAFSGDMVAGNDLVNGSEAAAGVTFTGSSEPGSSVAVQVGGVSHNATVAADGSWTVTFGAGEIAGGTYTGTAVAVATDAAGNMSTATRDFAVDTTNTVTMPNGQVGGDDIVSNLERSGGVTLTGTADAGSSVAVTFQGTTRTVTADASGNWSAGYSSATIARGTYDSTVTVTATDPNGNVGTTSHVIHVDTEVRDLTHGTATPGVDGVVNKAEEAGGLVVTGTVEAGSAVMVALSNGASVAATVTGSTWTATIPAGSLPATETTLTLSVSATDAVGNTATQSSSVVFDPVVRNFTQVGAIASDNMVNINEASAGFQIGGTVEAGATVEVTLANGAHTQATAGSDGLWSVTFHTADLPAGEGNMTYTAVATDVAGNHSSQTGSFAYDLVAPDSPDIVAFTRDASALRGIRVDIDDDVTAVHAVNAAGTVSNITFAEVDIPFSGETVIDFGQNMPNGSYLVVSSEDAAHNESATLLIVDNTSAVNVDLSRAGLDHFDFGTIDLTFAPDAHLTITEAQIRAITDDNNTITITGDAADSVTMLGAQDTGENTVVDGHAVSIYTLGDTHILLDDTITHVTI